MVLTTNFAGVTSQRIGNRIVSAHLRGGFFCRETLRPNPFFFFPPFVAIWLRMRVRHCELARVNRRRDQSFGGDWVRRRVGFQNARDRVERLVSYLLPSE